MPADVEPGQVAHLERTHRKAEVEQDLVDIVIGRAFHQQRVGLFLALGEHAVADEAVAHA